MLKQWVARSVLVAVVAGAAAVFSPAIRTKLSSAWANVAGWTEEARRADPAGFVRYASGKLQSDLEVMQKTRRELSAEIGHLAGKLRNQEAFRDQSRQLAEEFRAKYQQAVANGSFPIQVRNAAYTQVQAKAQVSMILAEVSGHEVSTARMEKVKKQAETQLEAITVRTNSCESQLAALGVQQEMLRAQQLSEEGERLLAQVDQLLDENNRALEDNPVRTVRELLTSSDERSGGRTAEETVEEFLATKPTLDLQVVTVNKPVIAAEAALPIVTQPAPVIQQQTFVQKPVTKKKEPAPKKAKDKPVFQQF